MIRVQFNKKPSFYDVEFKLQSADSVVLTGKKFPKKVDAGFMAYRLNGDILGDYSEYTEVEVIEGGYILRKRAD